MIPKVFIDIDGTPIGGYTHMSLVQKTYDHHSFNIVIGQHVIEEMGAHTLEESKNWLGKIAFILMGSNYFVGIVTSVKSNHTHGHFGDLIISGFSKTITLESGPHRFSWKDRALRDVVEEIKAFSGGLEIENEPKHDKKLGYIVQHKESHFAFLRRVACQFNEWMYYDGEKLIFGKPSEQETIPLVFGKDTENMQVSAQVRPIMYNGFTYNSMRNEQIGGTSEDQPTGLDDIGITAFDASKDVFMFKPVVTSAPRVEDKASLDKVIKNNQQAAAANLSMVSGSSKVRELKPGVIIDFKSEIHSGISWLTKPYGQYLVTTVHHISTGNDNYLNHFEAIPAGVEVLPEPNVSAPIAYPEIAVVLSNEDPEKKGRVQVQTQWQVAQEIASNWIRVMTPDAGDSDNVGTNRGFMSIPEMYDQVIVGYRYGDASRPFIMGSMYHGQNGAGGDDKNKIKSFTTRSGSTMTMDEEKESILLRDAKGNNMHMDGAGNISVQSAESITFAVGKSMIKMLKDGTITIQGLTINAYAGDAINAFCFPDDKGAGEAKINVISKNDLTVESTAKEVNIKAKGNANMLSQAEAQVKGDDTARLESKNLVDINGKSKSEIKGGKVEINKA